MSHKHHKHDCDCKPDKHECKSDKHECACKLEICGMTRCSILIAIAIFLNGICRR